MVASQTATRFGIDNTPTQPVIDSLTTLCTELLESTIILLQIFVPTTYIVVSSGFRSVQLNEKIGGVATSQHCLGEACDFTAKGLAWLQTWKYIAASNLIFDQLIYEGTWIHLSYTKRRPNRNQIMIAKFTNGKAAYTTFTKQQAAGFTG